MKIWNTGVTEEMDLENRKRVIFSNGVYIIAGSLLLLMEIAVGAIFRVFENPTIGSLIPIFIIALAILCLGLNSIHYYLTSRILFMVVWTFLVSVLNFLIQGPNPVSYFTHPLYLIAGSPAIHLLFSYQKERFALFFFLSISLLLTIFSVDFLRAFDHSPQPGMPLVTSVVFMRMIFVMLWLFVNILMAYVLKINWDFYAALQEQKELVGQHRFLLQQRNDELREANTELIHLNKQVRQMNEFLEKSVMDRTRELTDRNKVLSDYAFMNAHLLRSPVSRIKGLINLFRITSDPEEKKKVEGILMESAEDLDQVVHSISQKLNEGG